MTCFVEEEMKLKWAWIDLMIGNVVYSLYIMCYPICNCKAVTRLLNTRSEKSFLKGGSARAARLIVTEKGVYIL